MRVLLPENPAAVEVDEDAAGGLDLRRRLGQTGQRSLELDGTGYGCEDRGLRTYPETSAVLNNCQAQAN